MPETAKMIFIILLFLIVTIDVIAIIIIEKLNKKNIQLFMNSVNDDYNEYKDKLKEQNDELAKKLMDNYSQLKSSSNNNGDEKELFDTFIKLRDAIKENCLVTMNQINASRLAIYLLHNGVCSTHGINFFKMSCICEKVAVGSGVRERMLEHTNIPINLFDDMIDKIITNDRYIIINNDLEQNTNHKIFISSDKIKYTQLVAIYDINNNMLGFVAAEMDHQYIKSVADKEKDHIDDLVKQLAPVLSYSNYIKLR